jgi:hypothetical protein
MFKEYRQVNVGKILLVDRFLEISGTLLFALICCLVVGFSNPYIPVLCLIILAFYVVVIILVNLRIKALARIKNKKIQSILGIITGLNELRTIPKANTLRIIGLIIVSTFLDFMNVYWGFAAFGSHMDFAYIPIVWSTSSMVSILTLVNYGPAEATWVYLYNWLTSVPKSLIAGMLLITRGTTVSSLIALFLYKTFLDSRQPRKQEKAELSQGDTNVV